MEERGWEPYFRFLSRSYFHVIIHSVHSSGTSHILNFWQLEPKSIEDSSTISDALLSLEMYSSCFLPKIIFLFCFCISRSPVLIPSQIKPSPLSPVRKVLFLCRRWEWVVLGRNCHSVSLTKAFVLHPKRNCLANLGFLQKAQQGLAKQRKDKWISLWLLPVILFYRCLASYSGW